jgi:hypothetical protein
MDQLELINNVTSDIGNFVLVIFGFSITLFTVLYSFILSKKEQLIEYSNKIKNGSADLTIKIRESRSKSIIAKLKNFNRHLIFTIFVDLIIYILCIICKYLLISIEFKKNFAIALGISGILMVLYVFAMLIITVRDYLKITKT